MTVILLAATDIDPTTGHGPEWGKAAPVALLIILLMGIALFLLMKSMNRHLKRVPRSFERSSVDEAGEGPPKAAGSPPDSEDPPGDPAADPGPAGPRG